MGAIPLPSGSHQRLPGARLGVLRHVRAAGAGRAVTTAPSLPEQHRCDGCKAIFLPWVPASAESSAACPRACGGTAPAPKLMRWLRIRVNHLPAKCCWGVCEFLAPIDTPPCTRLSCSRPKLLHQMFCNKNPKPHESSQVSYVIITPNSGLPRVSVVLRTFPMNIQQRLYLNLGLMKNRARLGRF